MIYKRSRMGNTVTGGATPEQNDWLLHQCSAGTVYMCAWACVLASTYVFNSLLFKLKAYYSITIWTAN